MDEAERARDLLRPLAFADGAGLPWETMWAALAAKLSGRSYTDEDLIWLIQEAGSYVVEAMESEQSVYRLYHAALAEYLRQGRDEDRIHGAFTDFLIDSVPASRAGRNWSAANPYVLAHLATHAQRTGWLDHLLLDPGYLINASRPGCWRRFPRAGPGRGTGRRGLPAGGPPVPGTARGAAGLLPGVRCADRQAPELAAGSRPPRSVVGRFRGPTGRRNTRTASWTGISA